MLARGELKVTDDDDAAESPTENVDAALAAFGLVVEADACMPAHGNRRVFHLWPEHERVFSLWVSCQTQWRIAMHGATGMDYSAVEAYMRMRGIGPGRKQKRLLSELQVMERAALAEWAEQRDRQRVP